MSIVADMAITDYYRPLGLEPGMGKIAAKYGVTITWDKDFDTYRMNLYIAGHGKRTRLFIETTELSELRYAGDYDLIWNRVERACRELTDEMANLYGMADESRKTV